MTDDIFHGPPGVAYEPPTPEEKNRGAVTVSQIPSEVIIAFSPELERLFYAEVAATDYRNEKARELQDATLYLGELYKELRSINFRAGKKEKAEYEEVKQQVREERTRLLGRNGVMQVLRAEKREAREEMFELRDLRLALQHDVRLAVRASRMKRRTWRR